VKQAIGNEQSINEAYRLLAVFSRFADYEHGEANPFLQWLRRRSWLDPRDVIRFYCYWYPVSRRQPQLLLRCASAFPEQPDRACIMRNYWEEDGLVRDGDDPHYDLLKQLIRSLGGQLVPDAEAQSMVEKLSHSLENMTAAEASGVMAAIEHPALDISSYFHETASRSGFSKLLTTDPYLTIHVRVEPDHIVWTHQTALKFMRTDRDQVLRGYVRTMSFWSQFWPKAFTRLGYSRGHETPKLPSAA
jgi:hypothetical protein